MDALAVKQACKFAKEHVLKNGPIVSEPINFSADSRLTYAPKYSFFCCPHVADHFHSFICV